MFFWCCFVNKVFISNTLVLSTRKNSKKYIPTWNSEAKATHKKTYIYSVFVYVSRSLQNMAFLA